MSEIDKSELGDVNVFKDENKSIDKKEISSSDSPYYYPSQLKPYNSDDLYQKKGSYDIYDEMRQDDQVKAVLVTKKQMMLNAGWEIEIDEDDKQHEEIRDSLDKWLKEDIEKDFDSSLYEILTNLDYGLSITEVIWKVEDGNIKLKYLKTRAPHSFNINWDDKGNLDWLEQMTATEGTVKLNPDKFIIFPNEMEFDNWYGTSDLRAAYKAWWTKEFIIKAWSVFLDRFGMPTAIGKYDSAVTTPEDQTILETILKNIQSKTSITIPKSVEIEFLEATRGGEAGYEKAIDKYNLMIARSMLMPDLMGFAGAKTAGGSFALGQTQFEIFLMNLEWTRRKLEKLVNRKIIQPLVNYNWNVEKPPVFKFKPISDQLKIDLVETWLNFIQKTKIKPTLEEANWARRIIGVPEAEELDIEETPPPFGGAPTNMPNDDKDKNVSRETKSPEKTVGQEVEKQDEKQMVDTTLNRKPLMAEKKQDFAKVANRINANEAELITISAGTIRTIKESLIESVKKGKVIENKRLDKVNNLKLKHTDRLRLDFKAGMRGMTKLAKEDAKIEFKTKVDKFVELNEDIILNEIINESPIFISGLITDDILKAAQLTLKDGITQGLATQEIVNNLTKIFDKYDPAFDGARLSTIVRTNSSKAYNQSKQAYLQPFVDSGEIVAYQYSAIMDDRTTPFCAEHNGKIYLASNPIVDDIEPPNHFNCRSVLIPITKEEFQDQSIFGASKDEDKEFFPDGKFKESPNSVGDFNREPGGFWIEKK